MANILITGGTGFVGKWMRKTSAPDMHGFYFNREKYQHTWWETTGLYNYVVHLANIEPSRAINCARRNNARLLYCSSGIVYHAENNNEYRQNKIKWEKECLDSGLDVVIARLFTFSGEGLDDGKAIVQFERAARRGLPLHIWGDGSCVRSYMHGSELGAWMWAILLRGQTGEAYDVGNDEPVTMLELAKRFSDNIVIENKVRDPMPVYLPRDTEKTKRLLEKR